MEEKEELGREVDEGRGVGPMLAAAGREVGMYLGRAAALH